MLEAEGKRTNTHTESSIAANRKKIKMSRKIAREGLRKSPRGGWEREGAGEV